MFTYVIRTFASQTTPFQHLDIHMCQNSNVQNYSMGNLQFRNGAKTALGKVQISHRIVLYIRIGAFRGHLLYKSLLWEICFSKKCKFGISNVQNYSMGNLHFRPGHFWSVWRRAAFAHWSRVATDSSIWLRHLAFKNTATFVGDLRKGTTRLLLRVTGGTSLRRGHANLLTKLARLYH